MFVINMGAQPTKPGGATGDVQFNNEGVFGGDGNLTYVEAAGTSHLQLNAATETLLSIESPNAQIQLGTIGGNGSAIQALGSGLTVESPGEILFITGVAGTTENALDGLGNFLCKKVGGGIQIAEGLGGKQGLVPLVAGTVTVPNVNVTATSRIIATAQTPGGVQGILSVAINAGVGFTITSSSAADTSAVAYVIFATPDA